MSVPVLYPPGGSAPSSDHHPPRRKSTLAVTTASSLNDTIQRAECTKHQREIQVYTSFDDLSGHHAAPPTSGETLPDFSKYIAAMGTTEKR